MAAPEQHIPVDHTCPDLIPGHQLRVREVWLDEHALRVEYTITPALPPGSGSGPPPYAPLFWRWAAADDRGTAYTEAGGAYDLARDRHHTAGVLSLSPAPPPAARALRVVVQPRRGPDAAGGSCTVEVALPAAAG